VRYWVIHARSQRVLLDTDEKEKAQDIMNRQENDVYVQVNTGSGSYDVHGTKSFEELIEI
jgi:pyruvate dehydrogenase complex dehydrogenase (E1) component